MIINFLGDYVCSEAYHPQTSKEFGRFLLQSTFNVVNVEASILPPPISQQFKPAVKSGPSLSQHPHGINFLRENNIRVASLANNHIMDYGADGLIKTMKYLDKNFTYGGAGNWDEAYKPIILQSGGMKIGIVCLTHYEFGTLADRWDVRFSTGTAWVNHPDVDTIVMRTRKEVDFLFVFVHAGVEHTEQPLPEWRDRYRSFIELGCDAVIASHPHIVQGWEIYKSSPIFYSLGNFYFPKSVKKHRLWYISVVVSFIIQKCNMKWEVRPLIFYNDNIDFDCSIETSKYINNINKVLTDKTAYKNNINAMCLEQFKSYESLFAASGFVKMVNPRLIIRALGKKILARKDSSAHIQNVLRCESHRYLLSRAMKLIDNYQ